MKLEQIGFEPTTERRLFVLNLKSFEDWPNSIEVDAKHFTLFVAAESPGAAKSIKRAATAALSSGAAYVCTWGPDCQRIEGIFDEARDELADENTQSVVMTTCHVDESLKEAVWFFLAATYPDEAYAATTNAAVAVIVGNLKWAAEIVQAFRDPHAFKIAVLGGEPA